MATPATTKGIDLMGMHKQEQEWNRKRVEAELLQETRPVFFVTLNINRPWPLSECRQLIERLAYRIHRDLFRGLKYQGVPTEELIHLFSSTEKCKNGNPHLHLVVALIKDCEHRFIRRVTTLWQNLVPSGTTWVEAFTPGEESAAKLSWYLTKDTDRPGFRDEFISSAHLRLPTHGGRIPKARPSRSAMTAHNPDSEEPQKGGSRAVTTTDSAHVRKQSHGKS